MIKINHIPVIFSKFFNDSDKTKVLSELKKSTDRILFVDTPATTTMLELVDELEINDIMVIVRDHHDVVNPSRKREVEVHENAQKIREMADNAIISNRDKNPACSSLIKLGEFCNVNLIVADPDPDGLTAAMKAVGITYPEMDKDAAVLDGPRSDQNGENLSATAMLLVKGMATLPRFNRRNPSVAADAKDQLFSQFAKMVAGDSEATAFLEAKVQGYEELVTVAEKLAESASEILPGFVQVDVRGKKFHMGTLIQGIEKPGVRVTMMVKDSGPIAAAHHGTQLSLAVVKDYKDKINLQDTLPEGFESSVESGIISNTSFLLHVSEDIFKNYVFPALKKILA